MKEKDERDEREDEMENKEDEGIKIERKENINKSKEKKGRKKPTNSPIFHPCPLCILFLSYSGSNPCPLLHSYRFNPLSSRRLLLLCIELTTYAKFWSIAFLSRLLLLSGKLNELKNNCRSGA